MLGYQLKALKRDNKNVTSLLIWFVCQIIEKWHLSSPSIHQCAKVKNASNNASSP